MSTEPKFKFDLQGLIRTATVLVTFIVGIYTLYNTAMTKGTQNEMKIALIAAKLESHEKSCKATLAEDLANKYVSREEWKSNHNALRDDMLYIRKKIDTIYDRLTDVKSPK